MYRKEFEIAEEVGVGHGPFFLYKAVIVNKLENDPFGYTYYNVRMADGGVYKINEFMLIKLYRKEETKQLSDEYV